MITSGIVKFIYMFQNTIYLCKIYNIWEQYKAKIIECPSEFVAQHAHTQPDDLAH